MFRTLCLLLCCLVVTPLWGDDAITPIDPQLGREVDFYQDVFPILQAKCLACHSAAVKENDLSLESASDILKGGASGEGVVPGKPDESYVYTVATRADEPAMPPLPNKAQAKPLTPRELGILKQWIAEGAKGGTRQLDTSIAWQPIPESYKAVYAIALDPEQRYIYAGRGNRIFIYDLVTQQEVTRLSDPNLAAIQQDGTAIYGAGVAHRDFVHALALSPDGQTLASGGYRVVKLWEKLPPEKLLSTALPSAVKTWAVAATGTRAVLVLEDQSVQLWNLTNGGIERQLETQGAKVSAVAFAADGETVVTGDDAGTVTVWHVGDGKAISTLATGQPVTAIATRANGPQLVTGHADNKIRVWAWPAAPQEGAEQPVPQPVRELNGHGGPIASLKVLESRNEVLSTSADNTARLWNLDNAAQAFNQNLGAKILGADISPDGESIVVLGDNKIARVFKRNGQKVADVQGNQGLVQVVNERTDDLEVAKSQFKLAETALKDMEKEITQREESLKKAKEAVDKAMGEFTEAEKKAKEAQAKLDEADKKLAEKPDDDGLKKAKEAAQKEFDKQEEDRKAKQNALTSAERAVKLSDESLVTAKETLQQRTDAKTQTEAQQKAAEEALKLATEQSNQSQQVMATVSFGVNGTTFITSGEQQPVQVWETQTGRPLGVLELPAEIKQTTLTANGALIAIDTQNQATVWEIAPRWSLKGQLGTDSLDVSQSKFVDRVTALAFSPDGTLLATGGGEPSRSGEVLLWNVAEQTLARAIEEPHSDTVFDVAFSRDGQFLVSGAADKFVKVFQVSDGSFVRAYEGHTDHVLGVAFQADGSSIASCSSDKAIKIWNTETGEQRRTINNYSKQVTAIDFIGVTENLVSCSGDQTVKFHTASNGRNYRSFSGFTDFAYAALATRGESLVIASGEDGSVRVWNGTNGQVVATFTPPTAAE